jgi:hypothetical protein
VGSSSIATSLLTRDSYALCSLHSDGRYRVAWPIALAGVRIDSIGAHFILAPLGGPSCEEYRGGPVRTKGSNTMRTLPGMRMCHWVLTALRRGCGGCCSGSGADSLASAVGHGTGAHDIRTKHLSNAHTHTHTPTHTHRRASAPVSLAISIFITGASTLHPVIVAKSLGSAGFPLNSSPGNRYTSSRGRGDVRTVRVANGEGRGRAECSRLLANFCRSYGINELGL